MNIDHLTNSQKSALNALNMNVSVSAGAGTGKTDTLMRRFCAIVEQNLAEVNEIVTVTFTEKAAREMKQRIISQLYLIYDETKDERYRIAANDIVSAYIGTIHSFASRLLRENAYLAGIDPNFSLLDEFEGGIIANNLFDELVAKNCSKGNVIYIDALQNFKSNNLKSAVFELFAKINSLGIEPNQIKIKEPLINASDEGEKFKLLLTRLFDTVDTESFNGMRNVIKASSVNIITSLQSLINTYNLYKDIPEKYFSSFSWDDYDAMDLADSLILKNCGSKSIKETITGPARDAVRAFKAAIIYPLSRYYSDCLIQILTDFRNAYDVEKKRRGVLNFDDILLKTRQLLVDENNKPTQTALNYQKRFKYVMIDECQDTNLLQQTILKALCPDNRLFTVGDMKQSIYGFNNSDVQLFINHHNTISQNANSKAITFAENFRSRPDLIAFVNGLFEKLWRDDQDFTFERLVCSADFLPAKEHNIEFIFPLKEKNDENDKGNVKELKNLKEANCVANKIHSLLSQNINSPTLLTRLKKNSDSQRALEPGDILILFRSAKAIPIYERALREAELDYYVVSGQGFYQSREVQDLLNLLRSVENPLNDIALCAVLRSPFVDISEDTIFALSRAVKRTNELTVNEEELLPYGKLYKGIKALSTINSITEDDKHKLSDFKTIFKQLLYLRQNGSLAEILNYALDKTGYLIAAAGSFNGKRKIANITKLLDKAYDLDTDSGFSIDNFISGIEKLKTIATRESEAQIETEEGNVIRLMTVHKAKGLQAPVVFIADCGKQFNLKNNLSIVYDSDEGLSCSVENINTLTKVKTNEFNDIHSAITLKTIKEEKRLFYVAATRAEEKLYIVGGTDYKEIKEKPQNINEIKSWLEWLRIVYDIKSVPELNITSLTENSAEIRLVKDFSFNFDKLFEEKHLQSQFDTEEERNTHINIIFTPIERHKTGIIPLSVSSILDYLDCPRLYYYRYYIGINENLLTSPAVHSDIGYQPNAAEIGTAAHDVLSQLNYKEPIEEQLEKYLKSVKKEMRVIVEDHLRKFVKMDWYNNFINADDIQKELPFRTYFDNFELIGKIDAVLRHGDSITVLDFKTGTSDREERYRTQLGIYAVALKHAGKQPNRGVLLHIETEQVHEFEINTSLIDDTMNKMIDVSASIHNDIFPINEHSGCEYCSFKTICANNK